LAKRSYKRNRCFWNAIRHHSDVIETVQTNSPDFFESDYMEKNLIEIVKKANELVRFYWKPYQRISFDDDFPYFMERASPQ
jgi:hypothetical protein